jgi:cation diffusion facilitator CzcD-associated flavoprotein CzcO
MEIKSRKNITSNLGMDNHVIVIGAGPAGLAVAACLKHENIPSMILEQNDRVGSAWHHHYDRLHLHTDKRNSELPFLPYPKDYPKYISRFQLIEYLESYAQKFRLNIRFHQEVISAESIKDQWKFKHKTIFTLPKIL